MAIAEEVAREHRIVLSAVEWETYEQLLAGRRDGRSPRFTYDAGWLEIVSPIPAEHGEYTSNLEFLVRVLSGELGLQLRGFGPMTLRRRDIKGGLEPMACFYLGELERIRGKKRPNLQTDPPPDLAIEVDITHPSLDKLPIYARFGMPEVWRYDGTTIEIDVLIGGRLCGKCVEQHLSGRDE